MLDWIRDATRSIVAKLLLALLVLSFAAWGIGDWLRAATESAVAKVGDREISVVDFQREFQIALRNYGGLTPFEARDLGVDQIVLGQMAARVALDAETEALGVGASDETVDAFIREAPAFQNSAGAFDPNAFELTLRQSGLRPTDFRENIRQTLARQTLISAVEAGAVYPRASVEALWRSQNESRDVAFVTLTETPTQAPASEAELRTFYEAETERFTAPEYRDIVYLWLRAADRARPGDVSDDEIEEAYERRLDDFQKPERRNVEQVVFDTQAEADEAAERVRNGETFERVAGDRGLSPADIALGYITRDDLFDTDSAETVFSAAGNGVVGPVETDFGWALFNIEGVEPAVETSLEDAREELAREVALERAQNELPDLANAVEDLRAAGATLIEVGDKEELLARRVTVDSSGRDPEGNIVSDLPDDPAFLQRAFAMLEGEEMDLEELSNLEYFALRVEAIEPSALRPFETVQDRVEEA